MSAGGNVGIGQGGADYGFLGRAVGSRQTIAATILVHRAAANDRKDPIAVGQGIGESLQEDHAATFAADVAVSSGGKCLAPPIRRKHASVRKNTRNLGREDQVHTASQGGTTLAGSQAATGQVHSYQRGRAGGINSYAGPAKVQKIGKAIGGDAACVSGADIGIEFPHLRSQQAEIVASADADKDARGRTADGARIAARAFQGFPCNLQQQALLGIHVGHFSRGQAEEVGVELIDVVQEAAPGQSRVICRIRAESARRDIANAIPALAQKRPELLRVAHPGEAAAEPDDGDRVVVVPRRSRRDRCGIGLIRQPADDGRDGGLVVDDSTGDRPAEVARQLA